MQKNGVFCWVFLVNLYVFATSCGLFAQVQEYRPGRYGLYPADSTRSGYPPVRKMVIGQVDRWWYPKEIDIVDGTIYRYKVWAGQDSARLFQPGKDTFQVTATFERLNQPIVIPLPDVVTIFDDAVFDPLIQLFEPPQNLGTNIYNGAGWTHFKGQTWNTPHYPAVPGEGTASVLYKAGYVEFKFTGYKVEWYSEKMDAHGIVSIQVDRGQAFELDLYGPGHGNNSLLVWTSPTLENGPHVVRVSFTGRKNPASQSTNFLHDRWIVYLSQGSGGQIAVPSSVLIEENARLKAEIERLKKSLGGKKSH